MPSFAPYFPSRLLRLVAKGRVGERRVAAALLFAGVSGFTALTEKLAASGREGAEEIARVINRAFRPAIQAIGEEDGTILSFGGDALFAMFPGGGAVKRAEAAAEVIREYFRRKGRLATSCGMVELSVSQAIHFGKVRELQLEATQEHGRARDPSAKGKAQNPPCRRHYLVCGPSVQALARQEGRARAGEIRLSRQARERRKRERRRERQRGLQAKMETKLLAAWLAPRLRKALRAFRGGFRRAAILFLETKGVRKVALEGWFNALCDLLDRYDGMLLKSDLSPFGTKWVCLFGIPRAHENDPWLAKHRPEVRSE